MEWPQSWGPLSGTGLYILGLGASSFYKCFIAGWKYLQQQQVVWPSLALYRSGSPDPRNIEWGYMIIMANTVTIEDTWPTRFRISGTIPWIFRLELTFSFYSYRYRTSRAKGANTNIYEMCTCFFSHSNESGFRTRVAWSAPWTQLLKPTASGWRQLWIIAWVRPGDRKNNIQDS